jgi:uncharacterized protein with von Willebrand factor type A (vWA) domain
MNEWMAEMDRDVFLHYGSKHLFVDEYKKAEPALQEQIVDLYGSLYRGRAHELIDAARHSSHYFDTHVELSRGDPFHSLYMSYLVHKYVEEPYQEAKKKGCKGNDLGNMMSGLINEKVKPELDAALEAHADLMDLLQSERGDQPGNRVDQITGQTLEDLQRIVGLCSEPNFAAVMKLMGRFFRSYSAMFKTQVFPSNTVPVDVKFGRQISHVLSSELLALANPSLRRLFRLKFVTGRLLQFDKEHKEGSNRGPLYLALDISGSMSAELKLEQGLHVHRYQLAAALILVLMRICYKEKREFEMFLFGSSTRHLFSSKDYPRLIDAMEKLVKSCKGTDGTDIKGCFKSLVDFKARAEDTIQPDFVIISDLEDQCPMTTVQEINNMIGETRCHALIVHDSLDSEWNKVFTTVTATTNPANMTQFLVDSTRKR